MQLLPPPKITRRMMYLPGEKVPPMDTLEDVKNGFLKKKFKSRKKSLKPERRSLNSGPPAYAPMP